MDAFSNFVPYEMDWLRRHYEEPNEHTTPTLARITWTDSLQPKPSWEFVRDIEPAKALYCYTVGWVLGMTDDAITIAMSISSGRTWFERQASGVMTIPIHSIRHMEIAE